MAKRILEEPPAEYTTRCLKCATRFAYTLDDVSTAFIGANVLCPKCGDRCTHMPVKLNQIG